LLVGGVISLLNRSISPFIKQAMRLAKLLGGLLLPFLLLLVAAAAALPACPLLGLQVQARPRFVRRGQSLVVAAKVVNKGKTSLSGVAVRLDLPAGLVASPKSPTNPIVAGEGSDGSSAYWTGLNLGAGKRRTLKLRVRACDAAAADTYAMVGAVYVVNVTTPSPASAQWAPRRCVRDVAQLIVKIGNGRDVDSTGSRYVSLYVCLHDCFSYFSHPSAHARLHRSRSN
jgi:hypothetical protein